MHRIRAHNSTVKAGIAAPLLALLALLALLVASRQAAGDPLPACLAVAEQGTIRSTVLKTRPEPAELLARLVYAESRSTGFADDARVYRAIAWGVMNRVRLGEASSAMRRRYGDGIAGVIFRKGQFNPAVSPRSPFSRDFLCPRDPAGWGLATEAARIALRGQDNPFVQTAWEREHGLSLVVNFYYPGSSQARGPLAPWERDGELRFIGAVSVGGTALPAERVRFYRLATPPGDGAFRFSVEGTGASARALVAGYGRVGHVVGTIFAGSGVPYIAFDLNPARVEEFRRLGHPVYYGDVTDADLLMAARIEEIDLVVMTLDDHQAALRAIRIIRDMAPRSIIVARARDLVTSSALMQAGANRAFPELVEASLRLAAEALESLGVAGEDTELLVRGVRRTDYALVREKNSEES